MWAWFAAFFADVLARHGYGDPRRAAAFAVFAVIGAGAVGSWWVGCWVIAGAGPAPPRWRWCCPGQAPF